MNDLKPFQIQLVDKINDVWNEEEYAFSKPHFKVSQSDFLLNVVNVAVYRVQDGEKITIAAYDGADQASIDLFRDGSVLGAVLHQRQILSFHGNSFKYKNKGILICGSSGSGKSCLSTAFCQQGGELLSDDIAPVRITENDISLLPLKTRVKLWEEALQQLNINDKNLDRIRPQINKFFLPNQTNCAESCPLDVMILLTLHNDRHYKIHELEGIGKYNALRNSIYRRGYLKGMPETQKTYFEQLMKITTGIRIFQVARPMKCNINETIKFIEKEILL